MIDIISNFKSNLSAIPRVSYARFCSVMYLLHNVLDRARHAIARMLIKVNILGDEGLIPSGISKDGLFLAKPSNGSFTFKFVNYSTSLIHKFTPRQQKKIVVDIVGFMRNLAGRASENFSSCSALPETCSYLTRDSASDKQCDHLLKAWKLDCVIRKNGLGRCISFPKRDKITIGSKEQNDSSATISSIILIENVQNRRIISHEDYDKYVENFDSAAKAFVVLSRELVNLGLVEDAMRIIPMIARIWKGSVIPWKPVPFKLMFSDMPYTEKENGQALLHLVDIDNWKGVNECPRLSSGEDKRGLNDIACFVIPFLVFYKHSDLMLKELKKTGFPLTRKQETFLSYCANITELNYENHGGF